MKRFHLYRNVKMKDVDFNCIAITINSYHGAWYTRTGLFMTFDKIPKDKFIESDWEIVVDHPEPGKKEI